MSSPITLHLPFGKMERVHLSNVNVQNSPNQLPSQSFSPISSDGKSILPVAEARKRGSSAGSPLSVTPLSDCQEILQALPSVYPQSDYFSPSSRFSLLSSLLSHCTAYQRPTCFNQRPSAPPHGCPASPWQPQRTL